MPEGSDKPQIKVDRNGGIHVAWDEGRDRYNAESPAKYGAYRYSPDGGLTWKDRVLFGLPDDAVQQTALALSAEGNPLVVYRSTETNLLYFQASTDRGMTWGAAAPVPGVRGRDLNDTPYDNYIMDTDAAGNVHLVMVGFLAGDTGFQSTPRLLHLTWNGRTWSLPEVVVTDGRYPEWPRLVIDRGNTLHLTWFTRSEEDRYNTEEAIYRVWYSRKTLNAPETPALLLFTPAPTQTPTPISSAQSARLTPVATLPPELASAGGAVTQPKLDSDAAVLLVVSAVPTILFATLIWILRRTRG
jgi:hypothetical protein